MLNVWLYLGTVLGAFGVGFIISQIDAIIPIVIGRIWKSKDAWWRQMIGGAIYIALTATFIWSTSQISFFPLQLSLSIPEWIIFLVSLVVSSALGIMYGYIDLKNASKVIETIINTMFPSGGNFIRLGADDIGASSKILQFLEKTGGPYQEALFFVANGINSYILSWYLLGVFKRFVDLSENEQQYFVKKWMEDDNLVLRSLGDAFKALGSLGYYTDARIWKEMDFPGPFVPQYPNAETHTHDVPIHVKHTKQPGVILHPFPNQKEVSENDSIIDPNIRIFGITRFLNRSRKYGLIDSDVHLDVDVCIIGSGAAGAVLAYELSKNPLIQRVVLLERGSYNESEDFNQRELDMLSKLWKGGGFTFNQDYSILIGQGETLGGTTVINHAICIDTPHVVLKEWARMGVDEWISNHKNFHDTLNEIKCEINVRPVHNLEINKNNMILKNGAKRLNIPDNGHGPNPRNCFDCCECGFSHLGCHYNSKQSTLVTYIPKALDTGNCLVICDCNVERLRFDKNVVTGVDAVLKIKNGDAKYYLHVNANIVIVSAGSINSSALLLRSKVPDPNKQIGQGLSIHPSPLVIAEFPEEVRSFEGIPMSYHVSEYSVMNGVPGIMPNDPLVTSNLPQDQRGGFALESVFPNPGQLGAFLPGVAESHKHMMKNLKYYGAAGILIRDTPKGIISINLSGEPIVKYGLDMHDKINLCNGIRKLSEIFFSEGAINVIITHRFGTIITRQDYLQNPNIINEQILPENCGQDKLFIGAVHPQGGNRMGSNPTKSVVDSHCKHHIIKNLFVCDASVFPTATGVNPMLTIMGLAKRTSQYINTNWNEISSIGKVKIDKNKPWIEKSSQFK
jgi:choline dehydrogenase-like flavoprotein